ncbi:MAG: hypothetical protein CL927_18750 [Deltaproteobacteria bacterium]|nr:hypothetical protein [Deltaproteobacteria bacterium]HCH61360.1 hypothetical protein [Deltaproteobacteria bacterium]
MPLPPIIDPHMHQWSPRTTPRPVTPVVRMFGWSPTWTRRMLHLTFPRSARAFVGAVDHVAADYLPADYQGDGDGLPIEGVVHVEAGWQARTPEGLAEETAWLESLPHNDFILGIVGAADLESPKLDAQLDAHSAASARFRGVRDKLACSPARGVMDWNTDSRLLHNPAWHRGYARLGERGLSFDAWMYSHQLPAFRSVAANHPETSVVLCHMGTPVGFGGPHGGLSESERHDLRARWRDEMMALAELSHVHVKLSGFLMPVVGWGLHTDAPASVDAIVERIGPPTLDVIRWFGAERCMFASNFPMDKVSTTLSNLFQAFDRITAAHSESERTDLFAGTARRFYRL